jgi:hypothetical protein
MKNLKDTSSLEDLLPTAEEIELAKNNESYRKALEDYVDAVENAIKATDSPEEVK